LPESAVYRGSVDVADRQAECPALEWLQDSAKLLPAESSPVDDNVVARPVVAPHEPTFDLRTPHDPAVAMGRPFEILPPDCIPNHPPQVLKQRLDIGVMGAEEREAVALIHSPAVLLCQHLDATRRAQYAVDHAVLDPVSSSKHLRGRRALQSRPAGGRGDQLVGTAAAERTFATDHLARVARVTSGTRLGRGSASLRRRSWTA